MVFNKHNKIRYSICHLLSKVRKDKCNNYGLLSLLCCLLSLFYESHMQYFNIKHRSYALVRKISLNVVGFLNVRIFICITIIPWYLNFLETIFGLDYYQRNKNWVSWHIPLPSTAEKPLHSLTSIFQPLDVTDLTMWSFWAGSKNFW